MPTVSLYSVLLASVPFAGTLVAVTALLAKRRLGREIKCREEIEQALKLSEERWSLALEDSKKAEERLRESEQRYREIFDHSSDAIFVVDVGPDSEFRYAAFNPANGRFLSRPPETLVGTTVEEAIPPTAVEAIKGNYRRCLAAGEPISFEEQLDLPAHMGHFHTTLIPVRDPGGQIRRIIGIARDITERKSAEEALRRHRENLEEMVAARTEELVQSEARFRALSELIPNHVWSSRPDGVLDYVNSRAVEYFGRSAEQLIGDGWQDIIHPEDLPGTLRDWTHSLKTGEPLDIEYRMLRRDGEYRWHICRARPMRDPDGEIVKWFGTTTEIEEQKRGASVLHAAKAAAEEATRLKSSFLAHMSHEIRTPMNAILGFTQLLRRDTALEPSQRQKLETIHRSGEHLLMLINNVLEMSKIEAGHVKIDSQPFDLHALVEDLETMFRGRAEGKHLKFDVALAPSAHRMVKADSVKLRQIAINLLGNAIKFTSRGGIVLRVAMKPRESQLMLIVEVEDTGPGIAAEEQDRLFQQFEQTSTGRRTMGGTGLGLAISREFARLMGGDITVRSEVNRGSTFRVEVPVENASLPHVPVAVERRVVGLQPGFAPPRVLIADDAFENRELLFQMLRYTGFDPRKVSDGEKAVAEFESWQPQVVLMDLRMPVVDGFEAIRRIRDLPGGREARIIAVTASIFEDERRKVLASGADDFVPKPFRDEELFEKLRAATGVEYVYADDTPVPSAEPRSLSLSVASVAAALPAELRASLHEATTHADLDRMLALVKEAERFDPAMAAELRHRAQSFDYQSLLKLLEPA